MKIILAFDSFKGSIDAHSACRAVRQAILRHRDNANVICKPMADGGEGTARILMEALQGTWVPVQTMGPLPDLSVDSGFGWIESTQTAIVEVAASSGLTLVPEGRRNPLLTTTFGTGELIRHAIEKGARRILLAMGGSATVDGGTGAASALGWQFLDDQGQVLAPGGQSLARLATIVKPFPRPFPEIMALCDVQNPLLGKSGAARIFAPQKGATPEMVELLEAGLSRLSSTVFSQLGLHIDQQPGAGAAGGFGAGCMAFFGAHLRSGIHVVMQECRLEEELDSADWILTGEGSFDQQSLHGKVVSGIAEVAAKYHVRVAVLAGRVALTAQQYREAGVELAIPLQKEGMTADEAMRDAERLLVERAVEWLELAASCH